MTGRQPFKDLSGKTILEEGGGKGNRSKAALSFMYNIHTGDGSNVI